MIYFDYSANTPVNTNVLDVFYTVEKKFYANPNSTHSLGKQACDKLGEATKAIAELIGVPHEEIIYTSGATESNNLAIKGLAQQYKKYGKHIISTRLEHSSTNATLTYLQEQGFTIDFMDILPNGKIDIESLTDLLTSETIIVAISHVDSELGTVQNLKEIYDLVKKHKNCYLHVDITQTVGKIPIDLNFDTASLSAHKFYGLNGVGILIKKAGVNISPQMHGGKSTTSYRSGSPTLGLIVSMHEALKHAISKLDENYEKVKFLRDNITLDGILVNSPTNGIPHILNLSIKGLTGAEIQNKLDAAGICVSVKSACITDNNPSQSVLAVTKDKKRALSSIRISISHLTTIGELKALEEVLIETAEQARINRT